MTSVASAAVGHALFVTCMHVSMESQTFENCEWDASASLSDAQGHLRASTAASPGGYSIPWQLLIIMGDGKKGSFTNFNALIMNFNYEFLH